MSNINFVHTFQNLHENLTNLDLGKMSSVVCETDNWQLNGRIFCRDWIFTLSNLPVPPLIEICVTKAGHQER